MRKKPASKGPQLQQNPGVRKYAVLCTPPRLLKPVLLGALYGEIGEIDPKPSITVLSRPAVARG